VNIRVKETDIQRQRLSMDQMKRESRHKLANETAGTLHSPASCKIEIASCNLTRQECRGACPFPLSSPPTSRPAATPALAPKAVVVLQLVAHYDDLVQIVFPAFTLLFGKGSSVDWIDPSSSAGRYMRYECRRESGCSVGARSRIVPVLEVDYRSQARNQDWLVQGKCELCSEMNADAT
jgi:hypothetical protein